LVKGEGEEQTEPNRPKDRGLKNSLVSLPSPEHSQPADVSCLTAGVAYLIEANIKTALTLQGEFLGFSLASRNKQVVLK
jgi:hypothetical protein